MCGLVDQIKRAGGAVRRLPIQILDVYWMEYVTLP